MRAACKPLPLDIQEEGSEGPSSPQSSTSGLKNAAAEADPAESEQSGASSTVTTSTVRKQAQGGQMPGFRPSQAQLLQQWLMLGEEGGGHAR